MVSGNESFDVRPNSELFVIQIIARSEGSHQLLVSNTADKLTFRPVPKAPDSSIKFKSIQPSVELLLVVVAINSTGDGKSMRIQILRRSVTCRVAAMRLTNITLAGRRHLKFAFRPHSIADAIYTCRSHRTR